MTTRHTELVDRTGTPQGVIVDRHDTTTRPDLCLHITTVVVLNILGDVAVHQHTHTDTLDHTTDVVHHGDDPTTTALRVARQHIGAHLLTLTPLHHHLTDTPPDRPRHRTVLLATISDPNLDIDRNHIRWAQFIPVPQLHRWHHTRLYPFGTHFFTDLNLALSHHPAHNRYARISTDTRRNP